MDKLEEITGRLVVDIAWLINEVENLREAAHADQVVIQRLRRERDELMQRDNNAALTIERLERVANDWVAIAEDTQAKLARTKQLAVSLTERPAR